MDILQTYIYLMMQDMEILKTLDWEVLVVSELKSYYRPFSQIKAEFRLLLLSEPLKTNVEELSQYVAFLEPWKNLVMHGQDEGTQVAELQRRLSGRVC
jgi:cobalamin biosynthesis Co2+ chelatase CbiK